MMKLKHLLLLSLGLSSFPCENDATCTFPSYMTGVWYDNRYIKADFKSSSNVYFDQYSVSRVGSTTNLTCYSNSGNRYILRTTETISATVSSVPGNYYYYICMDITQITTYSFYYYLLSPADNNGENVFATVSTTTPTEASICSTTPLTKQFQTMVRKDYETSALQQCADPLLGNFRFNFDGTAGTAVTGNLTVCDTLKTANTSYESTSTLSVAFSSENYFGCLFTLTSGSEYYTALYSFDSSPDSIVTHRFSCLVIEYDGTNVTASQRARLCEDDQNSTAKPDDNPLYPQLKRPNVGGLLYLNPYLTCVPTTDTSDSNIAVIIAVVVVLLLLIAAIVGGILFYKFYYKPKKEREAKLLEEQRKPKSHIGMMKKALEAGIGGNIHKNNNEVLDMIDMEDDDIEGSITGMNPDKFREHNNNMKLSSKFIGTSSIPVTPSGIDTDIEDPNSVPENGPTREKTKLTTGFSASMQGSSTNGTPKSTADHNGHVSSVSSATNNSMQMENAAGNTNLSNTGSAADASKQAVNAAQPNVAIPAVIHSSSSSGIEREKSFGPSKKDTEKSLGSVGIEREKSFSPGKKETENPTTASGSTNLGQRQKSFALDKNETAINSQASQQKPNTVGSVNPFVDGNPTPLQQNQQVNAQDKKEDKLRKSVSFATEKVTDKPLTSPTTKNPKDPPHGILSPPKDKANLPGSVDSEAPPVITLPREPSNLLGPRDTTLPEIDLKKSSSNGKPNAPDMMNF